MIQWKTFNYILNQHWYTVIKYIWPLVFLYWPRWRRRCSRSELSGRPSWGSGARSCRPAPIYSDWSWSACRGSWLRPPTARCGAAAGKQKTEDRVRLTNVAIISPRSTTAAKHQWKCSTSIDSSNFLFSWICKRDSLCRWLVGRGYRTGWRRGARCRRAFPGPAAGLGTAAFLKNPHSLSTADSSLRTRWSFHPDRKTSRNKCGENNSRDV